MKMSKGRLAITTFATHDDARRVMTQMVEERLAACGTALPGAESIYRWKDKVETTSECVVLFKTTAAQSKRFTARLLELHPYQTPELLMIEPDDISPAYAAWLQRCCGPA